MLAPGKVICVGLNYRDHAAEAKLEPPAAPLLFAKWPTALIGSGDAIVLPRESSQVDFEGELALRIGRRGRDIARDDALDFVDGYAPFNDVSARDIQLREMQWTRAKSFDTFAPCGTFVPAGAIPDPMSLAIRTTVNGESMQDGHTSEMIFSVAEIVAFASRDTVLEPGDLIATGTPAGIGMMREPAVFLTDGDEVVVSIDGVGELRNPVRA